MPKSRAVSTARMFGNAKLEFVPMPHMREYLTELNTLGRKEDYVRKVELGLGYFAKVVQPLGVNHPDQIRREHLLDFQAWITQQSWKRSYQIQMLKYVRGWIHWLDGLKYITTDPWYRIKVGNEEKLPDPLTEDEVQMLFTAHKRSAFVMPPFYYHRREVMLVLFYAWGLRIHELHALTCSNMDVRQDAVTAINKGGRTKNLPYDQVVKDVVNRWIHVRSTHAKPGCDALLINSNGGPISIQAIRKIIVELAASVGLDIHPHQLRDTAATTMLNDDVAMEVIAEIMGHSSINQTRRYAKVRNVKILAEHTRVMSPRVESLIFGSTADTNQRGANQ